MSSRPASDARTIAARVGLEARPTSVHDARRSSAKSDVRRTLIRDGEIVERRQRALQVGTLGQLERIEAAARQIEQLIALDLADGAQLAGELVALAQQLRLAVAATFGDAAELDRHQADAQEILGQRRDRIGRAEPHAEPTVPQPPALALLLPARERQDQRAIAPLRILVRIAPVVVDDFTPPDELAHTHEP